AAGSGAPGCEETADGCYLPSTATVDVGGVVIMTNTDSAAHTYTSGTPDGGPDGVFDTSLLMVNNSFEWNPMTVGEQPYFCMVHPWMQGVIIVQEVEAEEETHGEGMDDHGDDKGEMMHPEGDATATGMLSDGTMVSIWASTPTAGEMMEISIEFKDAEHVNHDIMITQNGEEVLKDEGAHHHDGKGMHTTKALSSSDPVDITVTFQGYGVNDPKTGPIGEDVVFSNVVPEFGTIAMMILAVAIISIVAVTAKSRVIPRF
ncbi:MAG: PEFG-CTERM sorting domain-containing protein, partial [Nitrosopumilus sp.]